MSIVLTPEEKRKDIVYLQNYKIDMNSAVL